MTDLAKRFEVHPAQITTLKREFLERADQAFGGTSDAPKFTALESERDDLYHKIGELEMQRDYLKKNINQSRIVKERKAFLDRDDKLSLPKQAELKSIEAAFITSPLVNLI
jgi:hypothetical protein